MVYFRLAFLAQCFVSCLSEIETPGAVLAQSATTAAGTGSPALQLAQVGGAGAPVVQGVRAVMQAVSTAQQVAQTQVVTMAQMPQQQVVAQQSVQTPQVAVIQTPQPAVAVQPPAVQQTMAANVQQIAVSQAPPVQAPQVQQPVQTPTVQQVATNAQQLAIAQTPVQAPQVQQPVVVQTQPVQQPVVLGNVQSTSIAGSNSVQAAVKSADAATKAANVAANAAANANMAATNAANVAANLGKSTIEANSAKTAAIAAKQAADAASEAAVAANTAANQAAMANAVASQAPVVQQSAPAQVAVPIAAVTVVPSAAVPVTIAQVPESTSSTTQWYFSQAMQLIYGLTFAMIVKGLCVAGNVLVQVSPISQIKRWESRKCTGEADAAPYMSIAFGGWQWCFYGLFAWIVTARSGFLILVQSNCLGALLGTYYVVTFYRNCRNDTSLSTLQRYLSAVTSLALLQVCALSVLPAERALFLTGLISSFCSFIGATSVLVTVPQVIRQKDSRSIPGPYAFANFLSSGVWSLCGYILDDPMVMIPNIFSTCCATVSLGLKVLYPSEGSDDDVDGKVEEGVPCEMQERKVQIHAKKAQKLPTEFTPMLPAKPIKEKSPFPEKLFNIVGEPRPDAAICGTVSECGTGGTF